MNAAKNMPLIEARGIKAAFDGKQVLDSVDLSVHAGEIVSLIGPNGSGKTTLIRIMLGLERPVRGKVTRRPNLTIGYMPQKLHLDRALPITVGRFLALGLPRRLAGQGRRREALKEVGAPDLMESPLQDVSGGELQRVLLARALLREPDILVLDEPVQGVDITGQADLYRLIATIRDRHGCGVLLVSHDLHVVMAETDQVVCLNHHVCCAGRPAKVSRDPAFVDLFGAQVAEALALYHHDHDHHHDVHGGIVEDHDHDHGHTHDCGGGHAHPPG